MVSYLLPFFVVASWFGRLIERYESHEYLLPPSKTTSWQSVGNGFLKKMSSFRKVNYISFSHPSFYFNVMLIITNPFKIHSFFDSVIKKHTSKVKTSKMNKNIQQSPCYAIYNLHCCKNYTSQVNVRITDKYSIFHI